MKQVLSLLSSIQGLVAAGRHYFQFPRAAGIGVRHGERCQAQGSDPQHVGRRLDVSLDQSLFNHLGAMDATA